MSSEETKRDRVRRLVIGPMVDAGFRFKKGTDPDKEKTNLNRMADALDYLGDDKLAILREVLMTKGEGTQKHFWPSYATVIGWAEAIQPRALEDVPEILGWFKSRAGEQALDGGRLVAEFQFWQAKKRPPLSPAEQGMVERKARDLTDRAAVVADKITRDVGRRPGDDEFLRWYNDLHDRLVKLVRDGQAARGGVAA